MIKALRNNYTDKWLILAAVTQLLFLVAGLVLDNYVIALLPLIFLSGLFVLLDVRLLYLAFAILIPFSIEVELPGGLGTDLPTEPIMWVITGLTVIYISYYHQRLNMVSWLHPLSLFLLTHTAWIGFTAITSELPIVSLKFFLAKLWYIIPFYFFFLLVMTRKNDIQRFFKITIWFTFIAIVYVMIRHGVTGFLFKEINTAVRPIFRNHVSYAALLGALFPYVFFLFRKNNRITITGGFLITVFLIAIYFSYTRAIMGAIVIGGVVYFIIKWKWSRSAIIASLMVSLLASAYLLHNNRYLDYAPNYEKTIAHYKFDNLIEATYKMEDISTMERFYRWVAGVEMIKTHPVLGFGPGTFYFFYKNYTVNQFQTYVSDNPEKSGIHNYYLMTFVEQGIIGFFLILTILCAAIIYGEKVYHLCQKKSDKRLIIAAVISLVMVAVIQIINDLLEIDKVGPIFFISLAIIVSYHLQFGAFTKTTLSESSKDS